MNSETSKSLQAMNRALIEAYGPLLRRDDVADALSTSPESLGNTMRRGREPNVLYLRHNKLRFGRRVFYSALTVAEALVLDAAELTRRLNENREGHGNDR